MDRMIARMNKRFGRRLSYKDKSGRQIDISAIKDFIGTEEIPTSTGGRRIKRVYSFSVSQKTLKALLDFDGSEENLQNGKIEEITELGTFVYQIHSPVSVGSETMGNHIYKFEATLREGFYS